MDIIIDKLNQKTPKLDNWTLEQKKQLLELYLIISKKETHIFDLIYGYHGCDYYEDVFRDYNKQYLHDKATGVEIAIQEIIEEIKHK